MTDYAELIRRLEEHFELLKPNYGPTSWVMDLSEAVEAIKELLVERDEYKGRWDAVSDRCNSALFDLKYARKLAESLTRRAEKAEADLAAARAAIRALIAYERNLDFMPEDEHAPAIAAARAEGGE